MVVVSIFIDSLNVDNVLARGCSPMKVDFSAAFRIIFQHFQSKFVSFGLAHTFHNFPIDSMTQDCVRNLEVLFIKIF